MKRLLLAIAALGLASACASVAANPALPGSTPEAPRASARDLPASCTLHVRGKGSAAHLAAEAHGHAAFRGSYRLTIATEGPGGVSNVTQSGEVVLAAGETMLLSSASLDAGPGTRIVARLALLAEDGSVLCTRDFK